MKVKITAAYIKIQGKTRRITYPKIKAPLPTPLAEWRFGESSGPFLSTRGDLPLTQAGPNAAASVASPFGKALSLDGAAFLRLDKSAIGRLNIGGTGKAAVTVAAWVYITDTNTGFVGGCWQEDNDDPRRQYGLFYDLGTYGGATRTNFHVAKTGLPTPGYPFSRDYSASPRLFTRGQWQLHVGTYNGREAISYLDGMAESYPSFTDNKGNTYSKNPYYFPDGLNSTPCDFTVGAVELTNGPGNYMIGQIAKLRVWDSALTASQVRAMYLSEKV